jgi:CelD/BcsL family acetyltransferase involved in cellulose biosynthesis
MGLLSEERARTLYGFLRTASQEALDQVTTPGDDFDDRFGIRSSEPGHGARLEPGNFHLMLASAELDHARTTLAVLGCDRGRLLLLAARYPWRMLYGVDRSTEACWAAEHNLRVILGRTGWERRVEVRAEEPAAFELPPGPLALLLDRHLDRELPTLLARVERSLRADPRECVIFARPEHAALLAGSPWLRRWREGDGWCCLVARAEQPRIESRAPTHDPLRAPRWEVLDGPQALRTLAPEWDALAHRGPRGTVADSLWTAAWCEGFLAAGEEFEVHALRDPVGGELLAVLPLRLEGGLALRRRPLVNAHHPFWSCALSEQHPESMRSLLVHLLQTHGDADLVELPRLHRGGFACERLIDAAESLGLRYQVAPDGGDTFLRLAPWSELLRRLPANVRKHVPRKLRRLRERGEVELAVTTGGEALERELGECFALEAKGWKGVSGSPIASRPETLRFYTALARRAAAAGRFALYLLKLDGRIIAFEYCLRGGGRIDMLKLSYDPEHAQLSPGLILRTLLLEREAGLGEIESYHMGLPSEWKLEWASDLHPLCALRVYAPSLKALALGAGPSVASSLKLAFKARPRLLTAVRWGRAQVAELRGRLASA